MHLLKVSFISWSWQNCLLAPSPPANLSWLSDYVLGALSCSDTELNCAAGIWRMEIALPRLDLEPMVRLAWYCYASILPFQNILGHVDLMFFLCVYEKGILWTKVRSDMDMQTYFQQENYTVWGHSGMANLYVLSIFKSVHWDPVGKV